MSTATFRTAHALPAIALPELHLAAALHHVGNVALFLSAPFVGLFYILALPLVGFAMLAMAAGRALARPAVWHGVKSVALLVAAPFVGLLYAVALPVVGFAFMAKLCYRAYHSHRVPAAACAC